MGPGDEAQEVGATAGGVAAGRDVLAGLINTGNNNAFFVGPYLPLKDAYLWPGSVFRRVRPERFVGRRWLEQEIDQFLAQNDRGYFVVEADAGMGKTAFLAHLVKERAYVHHFMEVQPKKTVEAALSSLAAQLILKYELESEAGAALSEAATRPDYLDQLLEKTRQRERGDGGRTVLVIDGLDEAPNIGGNVLGLPDVPPEGVFFVVSSRPVPLPLYPDPPAVVRRLSARSDENLGDVRWYLREASRREPIAAALSGAGLPDEVEDPADWFVETLEAKSEGVWVYVHFVLADIERGRVPIQLIPELPQGLWTYYHRFWDQRKSNHPREWVEVHLPLATTLAAIEGPAPVSFLCLLAGLGEEREDEVRELLEEEWRPFLATEDEGEGIRYSLYHASLKEFLAGRPGPSQVGEPTLRRALAKGTQAAHDRIAARYLEAWGGLEAGLPGLSEPSLRDMDDAYGLRHLVTHLTQAARADAVLRAEWSSGGGAPRNAWFESHYQAGQLPGYLADVLQGWGAARTDAARELAAGGPAASLGREIRYALVLSSVNSLAGGIPAELMARLVTERIWTGEVALGYARQISDAAARTYALRVLATALAGEDRLGVLEEALAAARAVDWETPRAWALGALAQELSPGLLQQALEAARGIDDPSDRAYALTALAAALSDDDRGPVLEDARQAARAIVTTSGRADAFSQLVPVWPEGDRRSVLEEALEAAQATPDTAGRRAQSLIFLASVLPEEDRRSVLEDALEAAGTLSPTSYRAMRLAALAALLPEGDRQEVLEDALDGAGALPEAERARVLRGLAPMLPSELLDRARDVARALEHYVLRARTLTALAAVVPERDRRSFVEEVLKIARTLTSEWGRAKVLTAIAPVLPEGERPEVLEEALGGVPAIGDRSDRAETLAELAPMLPADLLRRALEASREIRDESHRAQTLVALALTLPEGERRNAMEQALEVARGITVESDRASALGALAPTLPADLLPQALEAARDIGDEANRDRAITALTPAVWEEAQELSPGSLQQALEAARAIDNPSKRAHALTALAASLPDDDRRPVLEDARQAAHAIHPFEAFSRAGALLALVPLLPEADQQAVLEEVLETARAKIDGYDVTEPYERASILTELVPLLPEPDRRAALEEALQTCHQMSGSDRADALAGLAQLLSDDLLEGALEAARTILDEDYRVEALAAVAPALPSDLLQRAVEVARALEDPFTRAQALAALVPFLPQGDRRPVSEEAFTAARDIGDFRRAGALASVAPGLVPELLPQALEAARKVRSESDRARILAALVPLLPADLRMRALEAGGATDELIDRDAAESVGPPDAERTRDVSRAALEMAVVELQLRGEARVPREALLAFLASNADALARLGGTTAIEATVSAIEDVGRWFP